MEKTNRSASVRDPCAVLITPPVYDFACFDLFSRPFGLLRVGRWLAESGYRVHYIDALATDDRASDRRLKPPKRGNDGTGHYYRAPVGWPLGDPPVQRMFSRYGMVRETLERRLAEVLVDADVVLIGTGMTYWYPGVREAVEIVRSLAPGIPIVAGGVYATLLPDHCAEVCGVDYVVKGEASPGLTPVLNELRLPSPSLPVGTDPLLEDPVWSDAAVVRMHQGCPFRCDYCASNRLTDGFHRGSGTAAFAWVRRVSEYHGTSHFAFYDDALLVSPEEGIDRFLELAIEYPRQLHFHVPNAVHLNGLDLERARLMRLAGFDEIRLGFESSSTAFHEEHGGKYLPGSIDEVVRDLKQAGFADREITLYILAGLPGQMPEVVEESIRYAASLEVRIEIAEFSPVPGTILWERCVNSSPFPIDSEPLYQNNSIVPMRSAEFGVDAMNRLKQIAQGLDRRE